MKKCSDVIPETARCGKDICCKFCDTRNQCDYPCEVKTEKCPSMYEDGTGISALDVFKLKAMDAIQKVSELELEKKKIEEQESTFREQLLQAMEKYGIKKFETPEITFTYIAPTTKTTIDTKALKQELPDIAALYTKTSNVKASVKITVKGGDKK